MAFFLIVAPLAVRHQFIQEDGPRWASPGNTLDDESTAAAAKRTPYLITNYERVRDGKIHPDQHNITGISLDEGSTLRSMGNKTYQTFQRIFAHIPYRYVATATPSPNEYKEIIYYAQFLGWMDTGQALTRWFKRDPSKPAPHPLPQPKQRSFGDGSILGPLPLCPPWTSASPSALPPPAPGSPLAPGQRRPPPGLG